MATTTEDLRKNLATSASSVAENPADLAAGVTPTPYTLPGADAAASSLRHLQTTGTTGLEGLLANDNDFATRRNQVEGALYDKSSEDINRQADLLSRDINEGTFGRGVGLSTITGDMQQRLQRERLDALGRARREAVLGAGTEARADQQARLAALGQAFNQGTTGLQAEANVGLTNTGREQQARQFGTQTALQSLLTRQAREQQTGLQREAFQNARDVAAEQLLSGGIASGIGGLAQLFGPSVRDQVIPNLIAKIFG